jgi:hypothetical protein
MSKTRDKLRREAESIKGTPQELEGLVPVEARIKQNAGIIFSVRFTASEMSQIRAAANARGVKLSELVREGALEAAARAQGEPSEREEAITRAKQLVGAAAEALERA